MLQRRAEAKSMDIASDAAPANLQVSAAPRPFDVGAGPKTGVLREKYHHRNLYQEVSMTPNIADIIRHHVSLEVRCIDRLYLHAYMPKLQTSGGLCYFLRDYLGNPIASPALFKPIHDRFVTAVEQFATRQ